MNKKLAAHDKVTTTSRWKFTSYWDHSRETRLAVIKSIAKEFVPFLEVLPRNDESTQRKAHFRSTLRYRDQYLTRQMKKLIEYRR